MRILDTTGAGDAFSAALAWALAGGQLLEEAIRVAAAGALSSQALGAREPTQPDDPRQLPRQSPIWEARAAVSRS